MLQRHCRGVIYVIEVLQCCLDTVEGVLCCRRCLKKVIVLKHFRESLVLQKHYQNVTEVAEMLKCCLSTVEVVCCRTCFKSCYSVGVL